jgi:hypothetical protein
MEWEKEVDRILADTQKAQAEAIQKDWLIRAVEQKCRNLTVGVANSKPLSFDGLDLNLLISKFNNENN